MRSILAHIGLNSPGIWVPQGDGDGILPAAENTSRQRWACGIPIMPLQVDALEPGWYFVDMTVPNSGSAGAYPLVDFGEGFTALGTGARRGRRSGRTLRTVMAVPRSPRALVAVTGHPGSEAPVEGPLLRRVTRPHAFIEIFRGITIAFTSARKATSSPSSSTTRKPRR